MRYDLVIQAQRAILPEGETVCSVAVLDSGIIGIHPATQAGLRHKGSVAVGNDGDFAMFAPAETTVVGPAKLHHENAVTPYAGRELAGRVRRTVLRGVDISADVETNGDRHGRLLRRGEA